jgi:hypothetical protein
MARYAIWAVRPSVPARLLSIWTPRLSQPTHARTQAFQESSLYGMGIVQPVGPFALPGRILNAAVLLPACLPAQPSVLLVPLPRPAGVPVSVLLPGRTMCMSLCPGRQVSLCLSFCLAVL